MTEIIMASPGISARRRESSLPLPPIVSTLVWCTTGLSLLALSTLLPIALSSVLLAVFILLSFFSRKRKIPALLRLALFMGMVVLIFMQGMGFRSESGTGLLIASMIIKQAETRTSRDASTMLLFNIIAPFTAMLQNQDPVVLAVSLLALFMGLSASLAQSESRINGLKSALQRTFVLLVCVAPVALLMYLFIPRLDAPMWVSGRTSSTTGVSERMDVSAWQDVMNDYSTAFRVYYEGNPPIGTQYYRGYVLWSFNGATWERTPKDPDADQPSAPIGDPANIWARYQISYEDKTLQRLFLLDYPSQAIEGVRLSQAGESMWSGQARSRLTATAATPLPMELTQSQRISALAVPPASSPRLRALVGQIRSANPTDAGFSSAALRHFGSGYDYSMTPARLDKSQPIDSFVFDVREGFCIHYSSAYALMLRMAGIPARVVTGYASSEVSDLGNYYRVRQADAHAWVEAWVDGRWVRFDPTSQSNSSAVQSSGWASGWRNSGYEMSDWFKSYWDQWIEYYDAGAQEKTIDGAQQALSKLTSKAFARPWVILSWVLGVIVLVVLFPQVVMILRAPSPSVSLGKLTRWLDQHSPEENLGERLSSRLSRIQWIDRGGRNEGSEHILQLQRLVFDPELPPPDRASRRQLNRKTAALLSSWDRMKKTYAHNSENQNNE